MSLTGKIGKFQTDSKKGILQRIGFAFEKPMDTL
jgi:hypothetical protein